MIVSCCRVEWGGGGAEWGGGGAEWCARWEAPPSEHEDAEPEHLHWPDTMEVTF